MSLLGGLIDTDLLDVSRATGLLPFFVLGLTMRREQFDWLARPRVRTVAFAVLATAFVIVTGARSCWPWPSPPPRCPGG